MRARYCVVLLTIFIVSCSDPGNGPVLSTSGIVGYSQLPSPLPPNVYQLRSTRLEEGAEPVLRELLADGFKVKEAWKSHETLCMSVIYEPPQLLVLLESPDTRIEGRGFVLLHGAADPCYETWEHFTR